MIRPCTEADLPALLALLNQGPAAAGAPPALDAGTLRAQMAAGLRLVAWEEDGQLAVVAGLQDVDGVTLMRHGRVAAAWRGKGLAARLLQHLWSMTQRPVLTAIWAADEDAVLFCERHGFRVLPHAERAGLLAAYWKMPAGSAEQWVVLADQSWLHPAHQEILAPAWIASGAGVALMLAASAVVWPRLPTGARIPIHWGLDGRPNGYGGAGVGLICTPALAALTAMVLGLMPLLDKDLARSRPSLRAYRGLWMAMLLLLALVHGCLLAAALQVALPVDRVVMAGLGALLAYCGSVLKDLEPNRVIGIRTRATLANPVLWRRVHQAAAPYLYAHGGLLCLAVLAGAPAAWLA
ncbi:MAG TPA: GNAT family N-acetyltransferase, partial [bacterium]|nr:GNAT family N-acetyltransferase [bacterium]